MSASPLERVPPPLVLAAAALSVQGGAAVATTLFGRLGATGVLSVRMAVGALALCLLARVWRARFTGRAWRLVVAFAAVLGTMNLLFYLSLERIPLGVAVAIELLGPLAVAVAGSRTRAQLAWAGLAVAGVAVLVVPTALAELGLAGAGAASALDPVGVVLILVTGACWAGYVVVGARMSAEVPGSAGLAVAMALSCVVLVPLGVAHAGPALLTPHLLLAGALVGVMSSALPYALEMATIRRVGPRAFGVMMSLAPAVALLAGLVVAGQQPTLLAVVGIVLVVAASLGASGPSARPAG